MLLFVVNGAWRCRPVPAAELHLFKGAQPGNVSRLREGQECRVGGGLRYIILCINERVTTRQKPLTFVVMLRCNQHEFLKAHLLCLSLNSATYILWYPILKVRLCAAHESNTAQYNISKSVYTQHRNLAHTAPPTSCLYLLLASGGQSERSWLKNVIKGNCESYKATPVESINKNTEQEMSITETHYLFLLLFVETVKI